MTLTDKQQEGLELLQAFIKSRSDRYFLVKGYAGTGKSTLINEFIQWYESVKGANLENLVVTAPTNKAVRVLKRMSDTPSVDYKTLHSLLGLRPKITDNGEEVFEKDKMVTPTIHFYGCVIVDEASMIDDDIFNQLLIDASDHKIIFVGDPCQIPPVNHFHSKPMMDDVQKKLGIQTFELTDIIRQAADNPIIKTSLEIRKGTFERKVSNKLDENGHGVMQMDVKNKQQIYDLIQEKFCSDEFGENPDYAKVIAWRNNTVDKFNKLIRTYLYHRDVERVVLGEKLIMNRPILEGSGKSATPVLFVNDDVVVTKIDIASSRFYTKEVKYYECEVVRVQDDNQIPVNIKILHEDSDRQFQTLSNTLKQMAITAKKPMRGKNWKTYYDFRDIFADVAYNYAITAHKSQGSTYENAFVCYSDITANPRIVEMQRILYTAVTRPSKTLYIL